jgi:hypothetical protein
MDDKRLSYLLAVWSEYMTRSDHRAELGYPSTAAGIRWRPPGDFDGMVATLDETMAQAVDAAVDSLPALERAAVNAVVIGPMRWKRYEPVHEVYERARGLLKISLNARGVE